MEKGFLLLNKKSIIKRTAKKTTFLVFFTLFITNLVIFIFKPVVLRGMIIGNLLSFFIPVLVGIIFLYEIELNTEKINSLNKELKKRAYRDYLTDLYNRRKLFETAPQLIEIARRYSQPVSFCLFDIDDFKIINDTEGHLEGDNLLIEIGKIMNKTLRKSDIPGRFGGDEFYIFFPLTEEEQALSAVNKIRQKIEKVTTPSGRKITCSFGITSYRSDEIPEISFILKKTDDALYAAKNNGKNRIITNNSTVA